MAVKKRVCLKWVSAILYTADMFQMNILKIKDEILVQIKAEKIKFKIHVY